MRVGQGFHVLCRQVVDVQARADHALLIDVEVLLESKMVEQAL